RDFPAGPKPATHHHHLLSSANSLSQKGAQVVVRLSSIVLVIRLTAVVGLVQFAMTIQVLAAELITLKAADGLTITADVYRTIERSDATWIVLAHQAQASRGEYTTIAPRLNRLGFSAIALDQRSGGGFAGVSNTTAARAKRLKKRRDYLAATPDVLAGIAWARSQTSGEVILWGSSYSAALALLLAGEQPQLVDGVVSHSPGEYLRGKSVSTAAKGIAVPVLITSPANEKRKWQRIFASIKDARKTGYAPARGGRHGSSALIPSRNASSETYWQVVETFLAAHFK
ncbi:MAG: alpha/beta hydrolase, partial [Hyphomicrobiaceae bacterium]